jgi:hypothetical protein
MYLVKSRSYGEPSAKIYQQAAKQNEPIIYDTKSLKLGLHIIFKQFSPAFNSQP